MPYNTKALKTDISGVKPAPQHFDPGLDDYDVSLGRNGASRVELYGPDGEPIKNTDGKLDIRASEIETRLTTIQGYIDGIEGTLATLATAAGQSDHLQLLFFIAGYIDDLEGAIGTAVASPPANTLLARLKSLEDKIDAITDGTTPVVTQLSGSYVEIGGVSFAVSGGDTLRGKSADKPDAVAAHAVIPYCYYFSIDTGVVEATDSTNWVVI